jgi:neutral ceramidase
MFAIRQFIAVLIVAAGAAVLDGAPDSSGTFRASVVKVDITPTSSKWLAGYPARQSTGVHDRLFHRIVALDDGRHAVLPHFL